MTKFRRKLAIRLTSLLRKARPECSVDHELDLDHDYLDEPIPDTSQMDPQVDPKPAVHAESSTDLLELPLVLVQPILDYVVRSYTHTYGKESIWISELLELRSVNQLFNQEILKGCGKHFRLWSEEDRQKYVWQGPTDFGVQILEYFIGENRRPDSDLFAKQIHSSIDVLVEQLDGIGKPRARREILHRLCHALAQRPQMRHEFENCDAYAPGVEALAFMIAVVAPYNEVIRKMADNSATGVNSYTFDFGHPVEVAISLGYTDTVRLLIEECGRSVSHSPWSRTCRALKCAAKRGYLEVIELVLSFMPIDQDHQTFRTYGKIAKSAAASKQWEIVEWLLTRHMYDMKHSDLKRILCCAARCGKDDIIREILETNVDCEHAFKGGRIFPLRDAAGGGHLSTCRLLIEKGAGRRCDMSERGEVVARFVARGGNVEVYHLLKHEDLWRSWHEIAFLPIAAEFGHLEFAKFVVARGCDRHPKLTHRVPQVALEYDGEVRYPDDLRYFALLRAVVRGHIEVVRWLIQDVGVDVNNRSGLGIHSQLLPLILAIGAGQVEMVKLLRWELGADPVPDDIGKEFGSVGYGKTRSEQLKLYQKVLYLREDYGLPYYCKSNRRAALALKAATERD